MRALRIAIALLACAAGIGHGAYLGGPSGAFDGDFELITHPYCYDPRYYNDYRVGGQYLDADNGLVYGIHFMLVRWQGGDPHRGVSVDCYDFGMSIDTRNFAHRPIVGGGYNDMYGYAFWPGTQPRPFVKNGLPTHLVLQANVGVTARIALNSNGSDNQDNTSADACFFAYLRDAQYGHEALHPIAILACTHLAGTPVVHTDAAPAAAFDYADGVWFGSGIISNDPANNRPFVSTYYTDGNTRGLANFGPVARVEMPFFRAHIRPEDWVQLVEAIESYDCMSGCPARGYSRDPADYVLEYAGFMAESAIRNDVFDSSAEPPQSLFSVRGSGLGIYRAIPAAVAR